ncbi:hypothetical protein AHF37_12837 [Paragonimus kellicotti]|nr:hypothetical protein AHF37_12837 [Paragonimus kellicotti]
MTCSVRDWIGENKLLEMSMIARLSVQVLGVSIGCDRFALGMQLCQVRLISYCLFMQSRIQHWIVCLVSLLVSG